MMKKFCLLCSLLLCGTSISAIAQTTASANGIASHANTVTDTLKVHDMRCGQCETRIHRAIKKLAGVADSYADVQSGTVVVTYDQSVISREKIEEMIVNTGYGIGASPGNPVARKALPECCK